MQPVLKQKRMTQTKRGGGSIPVPGQLDRVQRRTEEDTVGQRRTEEDGGQNRTEERRALHLAHIVLAALVICG